MYLIFVMKLKSFKKYKFERFITKLLPTLKDRNPKKSNVDEMKKVVREYLKDILVIDDNTKLFYNKFQKGIYEPELLFNNKEIVERIKEHPMIMWKLSNK